MLLNEYENGTLTESTSNAATRRQCRNGIEKAATENKILQITPIRKNKII